MEEKEKAFASYAAQVLGVKSIEELQSKLQSLPKDQLDGLVSEFEKMWNEQTQYAKNGAKLINKIKSYYGLCPEGFEVKSFKIGGKICKKCVAKSEEGNKLRKMSTAAEFDLMRKKKKENSEFKEKFKDVKDEVSINDRVENTDKKKLIPKKKLK